VCAQAEQGSGGKEEILAGSDLLLKHCMLQTCRKTPSTSLQQPDY
jgi:hypothetical protein